MWSGPRNLSTALMYAFAARGDCAVWDEPFYAAYLSAGGVDHPMQDEVIAAGEVDAGRVGAACLGPIPEGRPIWYQKHMTMHMLPRFDRTFMHGLTNVFLIRHPARVVASYSKKREAAVLADIGFVQQAELFEQVAGFTGTVPLVVDSEDIRDDPRATLGRLCAGLGVPFVEGMLRWPAGPKPFDGVWAPHWYNAVHASTGIDAPEGPLPSVAAGYAPLVEQALPFYQRLAAHRI